MQLLLGTSHLCLWNIGSSRHCVSRHTVDVILLALIPTAAVYAGVWLGRRVVFDSKEDLKELKFHKES